MKLLATAAILGAFMGGGASAAELSIAAHATGKAAEFVRARLAEFEAKTGNKVNLVTMPASSSEQFGQYRLWLAAGNTDVDVYQTDVIWAPQLADQFVDLTEATKDVTAEFFPSVIQSQTVNGKLVALPLFTDAPAMYYRKDLLEKYGKQPPKTWDELEATAKEIQEKERAAGQ
jgi:trehalose/maltose transport system substrate-binding protein